MPQCRMTGNRHSLSSHGLCFTVLTVLITLPAFAAFNSGSTGAYGALDFTTPGKAIFNFQTIVLDADNDNVFYFTTINIAAGCTPRLGADVTGTRPVYFPASGAMTGSSLRN